MRWYEIYKKNNWKPKLKQQFPNEEQAIDEYFRLVSTSSAFFIVVMVLRFAPKWMVWIIVKSGRKNK